MKDLIKGAIVLVIGGTVYSVSQGDIVKNFSQDTGMTHKQAEEYVQNISKDDLAPFDEVGKEFIMEGQEVLTLSSELDCVNYSYEWESETLTCYQGKQQLKKFGNDSLALGKAYQKLDTEAASTDDMNSVVVLIDVMNEDYSLEVINYLFDLETILESKKTNSYNKALIQSALEST